MKRIKYQLLTEVNIGTEDAPNVKQSFMLKCPPWSEANEEIAKSEAYNGEYTIEDDGKPEPVPTQLDRIEAQTTYTAMMTDTLMEG